MRQALGGSLSSDLISEQDFNLFRRLFFDLIGLHLTSPKKMLLTGRLGKRVRELGLPNFKAYYDLISSAEGKAELQHAIDLITTNETYFFREAGHFELLQHKLIPSHRDGPLRIWSAACSTGEEPYTLAMVLHEALGPTGWELTASDISTRVIAAAQRGLYSLDRARAMPAHYLKCYCKRGTGQYEGYLLVERSLRERVNFCQVNLMNLPSDLPSFDAIFLRNVIIYFDLPTKQRVVESILRCLKRGGWLFLGHSESLVGSAVALQQVAPSVYCKQAAS